MRACLPSIQLHGHACDARRGFFIFDVRLISVAATLPQEVL
jgi:hypothetical protein